MKSGIKFDSNSLVVSASPHIRCAESISKIMWTVNATLIPAVVFAIFQFGIDAAILIFICVITSVFVEYLIQKWQKKSITIYDGSAFLTGLLLAMNISPTVPWYIPLIGAIIAIGIAKHTMGGLGYNIFNPALIGRAALLASYPIQMTTWSLMSSQIDGVTAATPLNILKFQGYEKLVQIFGDQMSLYKSLFLGIRNGCIGETSSLLLLLGGIYLIYRGYIKWQVPVTMISTVSILSKILGGDPLLAVMSGGLILGAFYMATDMVTSPITVKGQIIFSAGAGILIVLIRNYGGYPEGVCYAILLMNAATPFIDRLIKPTVFGNRR